MDIRQKALELHAKNKGKLEINSTVPLETKEDLSVAYTPGVAQPCLEIAKNADLAYTYTRKGNLVAVVTDGSAVLGLGNIGALAGMPVMEGKSILFKSFAGVDAFPVCLNTNDVDEIVKTVKLMSPSFGGINLEDISAPRCFEIERRLKTELDIPVFHDDQHGTAVVVLAAIKNSLKLTRKKINEISVVINGAGAAGTACAKLLLASGVGELVMNDKDGVINEKRTDLGKEYDYIKQATNKNGKTGTLADIVKGADVFIGVSAPGCLTREMVSTMNEKAIVFAMANPEPEIYPDDARAGGALVIGTGRSDFPNQINNVLAFPGIFRGALDARARDINDEMKIAAAEAIAGLVSETELSADFVIPNPFDPRVVKAVSAAVADAAKKSGLCPDC